jgi:hypothetical protein
MSMGHAAIIRLTRARFNAPLAHCPSAVTTSGDRYLKAFAEVLLVVWRTTSLTLLWCLRLKICT